MPTGRTGQSITGTQIRQMVSDGTIAGGIDSQTQNRA